MKYTRSPKQSWISAIALSGALALTLTACGSQSPGPGGDAPEDETPSIAMLSVEAEGSPWADLAWSAVQDVKEARGVEIHRVAGVDSAAVEQQVRAMAAAGHDPIVVMQDELGDAAAKLAPGFPETNFIIVDSFIEVDEPNVMSIVIDPTEAAYIAGVVAAELSDSKQVGFVGGADVPNIQKYLCGFTEGATATDDSLEIDVAYTGNFDNPTSGREVASTQIQAGADIVMHAAALTGLGVISAAEAAGVSAIGVDVWQGDAASDDTVVWNALKDGHGAVLAAVEGALDGNFEAGQLVWDATQGAALYDERDFGRLDADLQAKVSAAAEELTSGAISPNC